MERRVLGSLMEKALSQPDYYPMTVGALVAACNQKSNRDPVMQLEEDDVDATLKGLRQHRLVTEVLPAPGARAIRYKHEAGGTFAWSKREQAIMTELLLRGPQTIGELKTRCARLFPFESTEDVAMTVDAMSTNETPWVRAMARQPGQSTVRYTHLLYPPEEAPATTPSAPQPAPRMASAPAVAATSPGLSDEIASLREAVARLEQRVAALESGTSS